MSKQVQFINRNSELAKAKGLIQEWDTQRVWCLQAGGGIGKTRLLAEIRNRALTIFEDRLVDRPPTIAIIHEFTASEWWRQFHKGVTDMAEKLNINLLETDAAFDVEQMARDLDAMIDQRPDAIVVRMGSYEALRPGIQRAVDQGIKVLTFDNYLPQLQGITSRISLDYAQGGFELAERLAADLEYEGEVAAVWVEDEAMQKRRHALLENLIMRYPDIALVQCAYGFKGEEMASVVAGQTREIVKTCPDLRAIWVTWDEYTCGVIEALRDLGRTDIGVYSFDLSPLDAELMLREDSPWMATVATNPIEVGRVIVRLATQAAYGMPIESHYALPMTLVERSALTAAIAEQPHEQLNFEALPFWSISDIGWTSDLRLPVDEEKDAQHYLRVTDIVDFDDRSLQVTQHLWMRVAEMLGSQDFQAYYKKLREFRRATSVFGYELADQEVDDLNQAFITCFNAIAERRRVVLFLDTTDSLRETDDVWRDIRAIVPKLRNTVVFMTGRNAGTLGAALREQMGDAVLIDRLRPLDDTASRTYLSEKESLKRIEIEKEISDKLLFMASGYPVLIDLAVEWRVRNIPLEWLNEIDIEALNALPAEQLKEQREKLQEKFEKQLVQHLIDTRQPIDWFVLTLAHIYPLDVDFAAYLLNSHEQAEALFKQAQTYVFVKTLPTGQISLHDEMRRMVNTYVWPEVDLEGDRRRRATKRAAEYLSKKLKTWKTQIEQLRRRPSSIALEQQLNALERDYWSTQLDCVRYELFADWTEGIKAFAAAFDGAPLGVRNSLLDIVGKHVEQAKREGVYNRETRYYYEIRLVKQKLRTLELEEVREILDNLKADYTEPHRWLDLLTRFGNYYLQRGDLIEAHKQFEEALKICDSAALQDWKSRILDTLGMVTRRLGQLEKAAHYHEQALQEYYQAQLQDQDHLAAILNNLCYVQSLEGEYDSAYNYCQMALQIREERGIDQAIAATHSTIGELYRNWNRYNEALQHYDEALRVFEAQNDRVWIARLYSYRGAVYRLVGNLKQAEEDLRRSLEFHVSFEEPWRYHVLGCVLWNRDDLDGALKLFEQSMRLAVASHDIRTQVNNLVGVAEVTLAKWLNTGKSDPVLRETIIAQSQKLDALLAEGYDYPHHQGRMQRVLGELAFEEERYEDALEIFGQAYTLLSTREGGYGRRSFDDELEMLRRRIDVLARKTPAYAVEWCQHLRGVWSDPQRPIKRRQRLLSMCNVQEAKARLRLAQQGGAG